MTPKERAENYASAFPKYPRLRYDDRWLDGFWVLGQDYRGSGLHGSYPPGFLKRIQAIFPEEFQGRVLHLFSGELEKIPGAVRVDLSFDRVPAPDIFGDAHHLPFPDATFDLIAADPPYTPADAKKYGTPMINRRAVFAECARILKPGGQLIWLDTRSPMHRKIDWLWWGVIGISRSTNHVYRAVTFYQRRESTMSKLRVKLDEAGRLLAAAFAILLGEDAASVAEAMSEQKKNTKVRETGDDEDEAPAPKRGRGRPPKAAAKDEDDEDEKPAKKKPAATDDDDEDEDDDETPAIPKDKALAELDRPALKALALKHGLDGAGKNREDLLKLLQEARDGKKSAKAKAKPDADDEDDDDEEEEKPAKKKKPAADEDDDDDEDEKPAKKKKPAKEEDEDDADKPGEDDYPKLSVMKREVEAYIKVNKQMLKDHGFFGGKPKKGVTAMPNTYDEVMGDTDLIKEAWADNIFPLGEKGRKKLLAQAAEIEDEDDDE